MTWLHLGMLAGLAGITLPMLVHLLARGQPRPMIFPALRLLPPAQTRSVQGWRIRRWWLLILRMLIVALLVLLLAGPMLNLPVPPNGKTGPGDVVLVLDDSARLSARVGGEVLWDRAGREARDFLATLPPGASLGVITSSGLAWAVFGNEVPPGVQAPLPLTSDKKTAVLHLDGLRVQEHGEPLWAAIQLAGEWLAHRPASPEKSAAAPPAIVVLSDFSDSALAGEKAPLPSAVQMVWGRVGHLAGEPAGLLGVETPTTVVPAKVSVPISTEVRVGQPETAVTLQCFVDDQLSSSQNIPRSKPGSKSQPVSWNLAPLSAGGHAIRLDLKPVGDWPPGCRHYAAVEVGPLPTVGLVTPDDRSPGDPQSVAFLTAAAFAPPRLPPEKQRQALRFLAPADLLTNKLADVQLLVLSDGFWPPLPDHPSLSPRQRQAVQDFINAGGHVLWIPGPQGQSVEETWHLHADDYADPLLQPFAENRPPLAGPRLERRYPLSPPRSDLAVVLRGDNGQPAILRSRGMAPQGTETLLTFSPHPTDGNLAQVGQAGVWVVLLNRLVELARPVSNRTGNVSVGQMVRLDLSAWKGEESVLLWPDGSRHALPLSPDGSATLRAMQSGFYRVAAKEKAAEPVRVLLAANVPSQEMSNKTIDDENLLQLYGRERSQVVNRLAEIRLTGGAGSEQKPLAGELAAILLLALVVESWLANRLAAPPSPAPSNQRSVARHG